MELLASFNANYNENGLTEASKFPALTVGPMTLSLQVDNEFYTARVKYNSATKWFTLDIVGPNNEILQGETFVADFPTNLLNASALKGYGLFYFPKQNKFKMYKLDEGWYNAVDLDFETAYKAILLQVFPDELVS